MRTLRGTVRWLDLEGGLWVLDTGADRFELDVSDQRLLRDGQQVEVEGTLEDVFGLGMTGPRLTVRTWRRR